MASSRRLVLLCACAAVAGCQAGTAGPRPSKAPRSTPPLRLEDIPVGGGIFVDVGDGVMVTRPTATTVKAYSSVCTHEGCLITAVSDGEMVCPCHGSRFRISDGEVTRGPAKRQLDAISVTLADGLIRFA